MTAESGSTRIPPPYKAGPSKSCWQAREPGNSTEMGFQHRMQVRPHVNEGNSQSQKEDAASCGTENSLPVAECLLIHSRSSIWAPYVSAPAPVLVVMRTRPRLAVGPVLTGHRDTNASLVPLEISILSMCL